MAVADTWEDLLDELEEPATPPCSPEAATGLDKSAKKSPAQQQQKQKQQQQQQEVELNDPMEERRRRQMLTEEAEKRLMDDLFAGCERPQTNTQKVEVAPKTTTAAKTAKTITATSADVFDGFELKTFKDCERFVERISTKILDSPAKSPAWLRLLDLLLKECSPKMDLKDLRSLQQKLAATISEKEKAERLLATKKKKPNDIGSQCRNYKEELDVVYGGDSQDDEEDYDDDEDFM
ncbi:hypothetical protein, conserved [Eimeria acervulina]|uniref:Uncharacterized protein n=1 Tax=Eimeria acervulina TaxID=5801 RepID=U6GQH6_EIMAC|nr:hypothetical protein, conserved [Eimeria acervulina]CDI81827.1 hypothetical protein, conserved [Eimeria acervulina]